MEIQSRHSEMSVITQVSAVEGYPLSGVPLYTEPEVSAHLRDWLPRANVLSNDRRAWSEKGMVWAGHVTMSKLLDSPHSHTKGNSALIRVVGLTCLTYAGKNTATVQCQNVHNVQR